MITTKKRLYGSILPRGVDGRGIVSIAKTATAGLVDTYTITYTDGSTSTFTITNGANGEITAASFAAPFSASTAYAAGDYVVYSGQLYQFTTAHAAGAWTGSDATAVQLANEVNDLKSAIDTVALSTEDYTSRYIHGKYIDLSVGVGNTVSMTPVTNNSFAYVVIPCKKGDQMVVTARGGNASRAWGVLDSNYKLLDVSGASIQETNVTKTATVDGYFVSNALLTFPYSLTYKHYLVISDTKSELNSEIEDVNDFLDEQFAKIELSGIKFYSGAITSGTGAITPSTSRIYSELIYVRKGTILQSKAGYQATFHYYSDLKTWESYTAISSSTKTASKTGYVRIVAGPYSGTISPSDAQNAVDLIGFQIDLPNSIDEVDGLKNTGFELVRFNFPFSVRDVSSELAEISYADAYNIMPQVYDLFDDLVTNSNGYVTRTDVAETLNLSYPEYANGVSGSATYQDTPAYKTYMYTLKEINSHSGNGMNKNAEKHRLLIIGGMHGNETAAPFNLYLLAKLLCNPENDENAFRLRSAFDVYIIPCLNGYGMYHLLRTNANGVNINRNFPIAAWEESGSGTEDYTGPSAGSEFETQIVTGITRQIWPNVAIDHHNYGTLKWQFYSLVNTKSMARVVYNSLVDCSQTFIKNFPTYFGTKYKLFQDVDGSSPQTLAYAGRGSSERWWYETDVDVSATIEISNNINYLNGEYASAVQDPNGETTFSIGDYTLRNLLLRFCEVSLQKC